MAVIPFQRFLDNNRDDVWRFLVAAVGRQDADDCFQETFVAALRAYPEIKPGSNLRGWVLTIANHKAIDHHRAAGRRPIPSDSLPETEHLDDEPADAALWDRVRELPEKQRAAILLRYAADLTHRDVAAALGCSEEAARRSAHEGLEKLRAEGDRMSLIPTPEHDHEAAQAAATRFIDNAKPDVYYAVLDLPIGRVVAASTPEGLVRIAYEDLNGTVDQILQQLADRLSPRVLEQPARLDPVARELDEYFAGKRRGFDLKLDWALIRGRFGVEVLRATAAIPYGEVSTYGEVATRAGNPAASRAAGNALGSNPIPVVIPCHRVLRSGGGLGGYTGGIERKQALLALERVDPKLGGGGAGSSEPVRRTERQAS